ncbi:hypothetical protein BDB01DRAFT_730859 [Pilobolus umbonatus]|nr:hypothetical protein BDB01DRAFT_730859 [Pilobolus umbonatus]
MQSVQSRSNNNNNCIPQSGPSGKLMSISSIIANPIFSSSVINNTFHKETMERRASAPSHPYHHVQRYSSFRSPPTSPEDRLYEASSPPSPSSSISSSPRRSLYHHQHHSKLNSMSLEDDEELMDEHDSSQPPLTLQERRLRNKAASAKYRQKKNQQQNEMRLMIGKLSEQNAVLERQLEEIRMENERLKATTDRLRGKMVAKKMLKKLIGRQSTADKSIKYYPQYHRDVLTNHPPYSSNNNNNYNYSALSMSSSSEHDDGINAVIATISSDQDDENDELESMSSD